MIRSALVAALRRIGHAHSERSDGAVGHATRSDFAEARARLVLAAGGEPESLVVPHQVHGARVAAVADADRGRTLAGTDGLATAAAGVPLLVQGADCPLVLLADDRRGAVAVVHSGWRGTAAGIAAEGVRALTGLGARTPDLAAAVFPGIGPCCFEVGPDVVSAFRGTFGARAGAWTRPGRAGTDRSLLDLPSAIRATLEDAGVPPAAIDVVSGCTTCGGRLFSHRASRGAGDRHGLVAVVLR